MILLLGGTSESRQLAELLKAENYNFTISTASEYGAYLAHEVSDNVQSEAMDENSLENFCHEKKIKIIIDATHPFAQEISVNAITISKKHNIKYVRYEREGLEIPEDNRYIHLVSSYQEASFLAQTLGDKILITTGSRNLEAFQELMANKEVYVRILPDPTSLRKCFDMGLFPKSIIALQGPFSKEFNQSLLQEKGINVVITKNSGNTGGVDTKLSACRELKIPLIIINKPYVEYPLIVQDFNSVMQFIKGGTG